MIAAAVDIQTTGDRLTAIGTLAAVQEVTVFPQVDGIVAAIDFKPGGHATSGQTLVKLDSKDLEVIVDRAGVALDDAKDALDRAQRLAKTNNMTLADLQTAQVNERKAEIDLQVAQLALNKRTISAPFDGTIGLTDLSVGDFVTSSKAIATLDDMTTLTVDFQVPERFAGLLAVGHDLSATAESVSGEKFAGKVMAIDSRIDEATRSLKMKASFPNQSGVLKPGMAVTVSIDFPGQPHPVVPSLAIQWDRQGAFVWKLAGDTVHRTGVTILDRFGRDVSVIGDLAKDDQVIVQGVQSLREGAKVARIDDGGGAPAAKAAPADRRAGGERRRRGQAASARAGQDRRQGSGVMTAGNDNRREGGLTGGAAGLFVRRPVLAIVLSILVVVAGVAAFGGVEVRELPNVDQPVITIRTNYTGATPETVDKEVTRIVEGAVARTPGVTAISSVSQAGQSRVTVEFDQSVDLNAAASDLRSAIGNIQNQLPDDPNLQQPTVVKADANSDAIMRLAITSTTMSIDELSDLVDNTISDRLSAVEGVADVQIYGDRLPIVRIMIDPAKMAARNLAISDLEAAAKSVALDAPAGSIDDGLTSLLGARRRQRHQARSDREHPYRPADARRRHRRRRLRPVRAEVGLALQRQDRRRRRHHPPGEIQYARRLAGGEGGGRRTQPDPPQGRLHRGHLG